MLLAWVVVLGVSTPVVTEPAEPHDQTNTAPRAATAIYDPNPAHLWNRLHRAIYVRIAPDGTEYGDDRLDPLLWINTKYLRSGSSYQQFIAMLDELIAGGRQALPSSPLKRALLQRDLWGVFDWLDYSPLSRADAGCDTDDEADAQRMALSIRLARAIRLLALTEDQLRGLPDSYAAAVASKTFRSAYAPEHPERPFLPPDLFQTNGNWVGLRSDNNALLAPRHVEDFGGRSVFRVFLSVPGGRQATLDYLKTLREIPQPWVTYDDPNTHERRISPNPDVPQFPVGTQVALVRQMMLVSDRGEIFPTHLTESIQVRVFREIRVNTEHHSPQDVYEFQLSSPKLLTGRDGGLRAVEPQERDFFVQFMTGGIDPFEDVTNYSGTNATERARYIEARRGATLFGCLGCHGPAGIRSFASYTRQFMGGPVPSAFIESAPESSFASEAWQAKTWKALRHEWGLLQGLGLAESGKAE
jgi:hypothetical protein